MTQPPTLTGQDIGQAEKATRAVLDRLLAQTGTGFHEWVIINILATSGQELDQDELAGRVTYGLKIDDSPVRAAMAELVDQGLIGRAPATAVSLRIALTPAGIARFRQVQERLGQITQRIYGDLPAPDLATAQRVLATVTERANAELAR